MVVVLTKTPMSQFGGKLAVNLPSRTDRRDVLILKAAHTGIDIQWINGAKGEDLSQKGILLVCDL